MGTTVAEKLRSIIADITGIPAANIRPENRLREDLGVDLAAAIDIAICIEDVFPSVGDVTDAQWEQFRTFDCVRQFVEQRTSNENHRPA